MLIFKYFINLPSCWGGTDEDDEMVRKTTSKVLGINRWFIIKDDDERNLVDQNIRMNKNK